VPGGADGEQEGEREEQSERLDQGGRTGRVDQVGVAAAVR
jgi:hypothetical protein